MRPHPHQADTPKMGRGDSEADRLSRGVGHRVEHHDRPPSNKKPTGQTSLNSHHVKHHDRRPDPKRSGPNRNRKNWAYRQDRRSCPLRPAFKAGHSQQSFNLCQAGPLRVRPPTGTSQPTVHCGAGWGPAQAGPPPYPPPNRTRSTPHRRTTVTRTFTNRPQKVTQKLHTDHTQSQTNHPQSPFSRIGNKPPQTAQHQQQTKHTTQTQQPATNTDTNTCPPKTGGTFY